MGAYAVYAVVFSIAAKSGSAVAVRLSDGHLLWQTAVPTNGGNPQVYSDGQTIVVDSGQAGLIGLDPSNGSIRWSRQVQTAGRGVLHHGVLYISLPDEPYDPGGTAPALAAYRASDGVELWKIRIRTGAINSDLIANEHTLFVNSGYAIAALSQEDGHQLWSSADPASLYIVGASPQLALVNKADHPVNGVDALDGHALWSAASADFSEVGGGNGSVTTAAGLIIGSQNKTLIALHDRDGVEAWRVQFQGYPYLSTAGRSRWRLVCLSRGPRHVLGERSATDCRARRRHGRRLLACRSAAWRSDGAVWRRGPLKRRPVMQRCFQAIRGLRAWSWRMLPPTGGHVQPHADASVAE